ncbi:MAG: hypothetical protein HN348_04865, partial [Proteobacteria bacterium]|nr:hypothetical protein [Pseudomonadota bacterium]
MKRIITGLALLMPSTALAWPADSDWVPLYLGASVVEDVAGDHQTDASLDLVGDSLSPALLWHADSDSVYFRLQVSDDPESNSMFEPWTWGVLVDIDGDDTNFEYLIASSGASAEIEAYENDGTAGVAPAVEHYSYVAYLDQTDAVRRAENASHFAVDLRVSRAELDTELGIGDLDALRFVGFTGASVYGDRADVAGCDASLDTCDDLTSLFSYSVYIDQDEDGLTNPQEKNLNSNESDADSDDDGLIDGDETLGDADGDGYSDVMDCDSDNDGLLDGTEAGLLSTNLHQDTNLANGCFFADEDTVALPTDPYDWDTDGGTLADGIEDWDFNGKLDAPWETDPNDSTDDVDSDGDLIADVLELLGADGEVNDLDSDGDGISDGTEWLYDDDNDGLPNFLDVDSDGDGIDDSVEGAGDDDGDGTSNYLDSDSDGDGISDLIEGDGDSDLDGTADFLDLDSDDDGIEDEDEGAVDSDSDGFADFIDDDSDDDGILDEDEGNDDQDNDGTPNYLDLDSDNDGLPDEIETNIDTDNDDRPDYLDTDSDGDGTPDSEELDGDDDCDGIPNYIDNDHDSGFCDTGVEIPGETGDFEVDDNPRDVLFGGGKFTGGACNLAPVGAGWLPSLLALGFLMRRRRALGAIVAGLTVSGSGLAQDDLGLNAQRFSPSVDGRTFVTLEDDELAPAWSFGGGLWVNHANDPFVYRPDNDTLDETAILSAVTTASVVASYSFGPVRVGIDVPVHLQTAGYNIDRIVNSGDTRLSIKGAFLRAPVGSVELGLGGVLDTTFPTGSPKAWVGSKRVGAKMAAISSLRWNNLVAVANIGARSGTGQVVADLKVASALEWGVGASYFFTKSIWATAELEGEHWFANKGQAVTPMEWLATVHVNPAQEWVGTFGAGTGLTRGVGAPDYRIVGAVTWSPGRRAVEAEVPVDAVVDPVTVQQLPIEPGHVVVRAVSPSGDPVKGAEVRILGTLGKQMKTGSDGILEADLPPGEYEASVAAPGWVGQSLKFELEESGTTDL